MSEGAVTTSALAVVLLAGPAVALPIAQDTPLGESAKLVPDDVDEPGPNDDPNHAFVHFGSSVGLDEGTAIVGTAFDRRSPADWAYIFQRSADGTWNQETKLDSPAPESGGFGQSVDVDASNGIAVVGDPGKGTAEGEMVGAAYVFERADDGGWLLTATFEGADPGEHGAHFGTSVAVDEATIVVGSPLQRTGDDMAGAAHVYHKEDGTWTKLGERHGSDYKDLLGNMVDVENGIVAVGAPGEATPAGPWSGAIHLYRVGDDGLAKIDRVHVPPPVNGDGDMILGWPVRLSEDASRVIGGAIFGEEVRGITLHPVGPTYNIGAAYVFEMTGDGEAFTYHGELSNPLPLPQERFGQSVALDETGETAFVSASQAGGMKMGAVYTFVDVGGEWVHAGTLRGSDTGPEDLYGRQIDFDDGRLLVGAPFDDDRRDGSPPPLDDVGSLPGLMEERGASAGSAYVFEEPLPATR